MQVHKAFEYLQKAEEVDKPDRWYDVRVKRSDSTQPSQRGIYLRDPWHSRRPVSFTCEVKPNMRRVRPHLTSVSAEGAMSNATCSHLLKDDIAYAAGIQRAL